VGGALRTGEPFGGYPLPPIEAGEGGIEIGVEVDAQPGIAAGRLGPGAIRRTCPSNWSLLSLDRATVVETTDPIKVDGDGGRTQSGLGMRGHVGQARIIAGEKPGEYAGGWCSQTWCDRLQLGYSSGLP
jgi:hypothetical protein